MTSPTTLNITRDSLNVPWGLRIGGGLDFRQQLQIKKVDPGSPAAHCGLNYGDAVVAIGQTNAQNLTHMQASHLIKSAGNHLQLTVLKGHFQELSGIKPKGPVKFSPWRNKQQ